MKSPRRAFLLLKHLHFLTISIPGRKPRALILGGTMYDDSGIIAVIGFLVLGAILCCFLVEGQAHTERDEAVNVLLSYMCAERNIDLSQGTPAWIRWQMVLRFDKERRAQ